MMWIVIGALSLATVAIAGGLEEAIMAAQKAQQAHSDTPVCPFSDGGFHLLNQSANSTTAASLCAQYGWRLAALTDLNYEFALNVALQCQFFDGKWIASFNGLNQDPCMYLDALGGVQASVDPMECVGAMRVMCQEVPVVVVEETAVTTETATSGTITRYTIVTRIPTHRPPCHHKDDIVKSLPTNNNQQQCQDCDSYVDIPRSNLKIIKVPTSFEKAAAACARHGWTLADVTTGMYKTLRRGRQAAFGEDAYLAALWARSFEGVAGGRCLRVSVWNREMGVTFGLTPGRCKFREQVYPLCQCGGPLPTGYGPHQGSTTTTTTVVTTETIVPTTVPETTTTSTMTVCQQCRPRVDPSSHGRHRRRPLRHHSSSSSHH